MYSSDEPIPKVPALQKGYLSSLQRMPSTCVHVQVNYELMQRMQGRRVCLICEVKGAQPDGSYIVRTADDAEVYVRPAANPRSWTETPFVEVRPRTAGCLLRAGSALLALHLTAVVISAALI
jgi:hypothetical protein